MCSQRACGGDFYVCSHPSFPAFVVADQDSRVELRHVTHSPTFVFEGAFSWSLKVSDIRAHVPHDTHIDSMVLKTIAEPILKNISDSIMDALKDVLANDGSMFVVSGEERWGNNPDFSRVDVERSGLIVALNSSGQLRGGANFKTFFSQYLNLKEFQHRIIDHVHQKTSSPAVLDLVSNETLQACFSSSIIKSRIASIHCISLFLQIFLTNGPSRTIPATFDNAPGAFELSAAPLLLQRVLPMPTQPQLEALGTVVDGCDFIF